MVMKVLGTEPDALRGASGTEVLGAGGTAGRQVQRSRVQAGHGQGFCCSGPGKVLFKASSPEAPVSSTRSPHPPLLNQHKKQQFNSPLQDPLICTAIPAGLRTRLHSFISSRLHNSY